MDELFPMVAGFVLGILFATGSRWLRLWWLRSMLILLAGISATILSGEFRVNWAFLLVDIGEVALLAWIGFVATSRLCRHLGAASAKNPVRLS